MKKTRVMKLTPEEAELIEAIRNYCDSFPNGYPALLEFAPDLCEKLTDMPK